MARIFLSYSLSDQDLVRKIETYLQEIGHSIEIKVDKPPAGRRRERLSNALISADVIIPFLSERGLQSNYVSSEIGSGRVLAQTKNALLLPIVVSNIYRVPAFISDDHCFTDLRITKDAFFLPWKDCSQVRARWIAWGAWPPKPFRSSSLLKAPVSLPLPP
jgi:hypothetical protein